jgi:peroxiredoxin
MKKGVFWALLGCLAIWAAVPAWGAPPREGDAFPALELKAPEGAGGKYLGLAPGTKTFRLEQLKAQAVLVEVFSMYCTICQAEAPRMNEIYATIQQRGLGDKLKLLGLGAGNSEIEVGVFRDKYKVAFPLLPDSDYAVHKGLGEPRTPLLLLVRLVPGQPPAVVMSHLGPLGETQAFLDKVLERAALK